MSTPDFETLLESPFEEGEQPPRRGVALIGGFVLGVVLVLGFSAIASSGDDSATPETTTATSEATTSDQPVAASVDDFPAGFVPITEDLAARPLEIIEFDDHYIMSFTTATRRGVDPRTTEVPLGGRWQLDSADGVTVAPTRTIYDRFRPGVFALEFERLPGTGPDALKMIERWDPVTSSVRTDLAFAETPFSIEESVTIALGDGATLVIEELELGRFLGSVVWSIRGDGSPRGIAEVRITLMDADDVRRGGYGSFAPSRDPLPAGEALDLFWTENFPIDQDGASRIQIDATVSLVQVALVDATFTDLPLID